MIYKNKIEKGLFGWISKIKDRMYRTITPRGYHIGQAAKEFIKGDTRDMSKFTPLENEVWARYLGTKYEGPSNLEPAIYRPTKGEATYDDVVKLKDESLILSDDVLKLLLDNYKKTGKKSMLVEGNESGLGTYTISMGEDKNGKYISYYDDWDINPTRGISAKYNIPILNLIGDIVPGTHPFSVYGRRYYKNGGLIRKMLTAAGGPIYWLRKRLYNNIEPFGYNNVGSRLIDAIVFNKNEHNNFKGDYSDTERAPVLYLTIDNIWGEYLHIPEKERRYSNGKYKIKNNGNGTFSLPFESMDDIMQAVNSLNNPLLWGLRGKLGNSVVGEYDVHRGYDKNGDYLKYIDHWRINPYDVKEGKEYGLDNNSLLKWYFKGKDDASFGLGTPVEIQGKYYLDDIYNVKGKDRGGHYLPEITVTGKKKQGGKMNAIEQFKQGSKIHIKKKNRGKFTAYCGGNVTSACIAKAKASGNPTLVKRATFAANARKWKHLNGGIIKAETGLSTSSFIDPMIVDYIKAIENPNRVGWNGKIWKAPGLKGYDLNLRGYGIDINTNNAARKLTAGRQGQWLTDDEANTLMLDHIRYIMNAANKHIKGFGELPIGRKAALLGMLYRGDSVNKSNINITEPDDTKFFNSVHNYYISKGLKERAANSSKFFKSHENSNNTTLNFNFNNYKDLNYPFKYIQ